MGDNYWLGLGTGANSRPDWQIGSIDGSYLDIRCGEAADTADMKITTSGYLGINMTPSNHLDVQGRIRSYATSTGESTFVAEAETGGGDTFISFDIDGGLTWCVGVDNSDNDTFKISMGGDPHVNERFYILPDGNYNFTGTDVSDRKFKDNIKDIGDSLDLIGQLKPKTFVMKKHPDLIRGGFIAQDVKEIIPSLVNEGEYGMGLDYHGVLAYLTKAVQ